MSLESVTETRVTRGPQRRAMARVLASAERRKRRRGAGVRWLVLWLGWWWDLPENLLGAGVDRSGRGPGR